MLVDGTILLGLGRYALSEEFAPIELAFTNELDSELPLAVGVNTSGYNSCQVEVFSSEKQSVWKSPVWGTEPNRSNFASIARLGGGGAKGHSVRAIVRPTRKVIPGVAMAIYQGTDLDEKQIEMLAEKVRFVVNPAHLPTGAVQGPVGGHFEVVLYRDSTVKVQIWSGNYARSSPVYQMQSHNVAAGPKSGAVGPEDYGRRPGVAWEIHCRVDLYAKRKGASSYFSLFVVWRGLISE